ncbi:MAG: DNA-processing protein DprA, partial [Erysipelotrichaceae bacterium]|nr:DNA-processing protein DprA [Erysipelotrichaceae bacterium]
MVTAREIIIYFAIIHEGNWHRIYKSIETKEVVDKVKLSQVLNSFYYNCVTILDPEYPDSLKQIYEPPFVLFYYGDLRLLKMTRLVAIVGTREPSSYAIKATKEIISHLEDTVVVSGLASGIDSVAHKAALDHQLMTIAVLGSGIDNCYPRHNLELYERIKNEQLLISEYPRLTPPHDYHFPKRNRIIAALSKAVVVIEARKKSGTLITVNHALVMGKDIYALPHEINADDETNTLIKDG